MTNETKHTPTRNPIHIVKCSCGHRSCDYHGTSDGKFGQGNGYDKETAERHAVAVNCHDELVEALERVIEYHVPKINPLSDAAILAAQAALTKARGEA